MTAAQYRRIIEHLGLSQEAAGVWLGVSKRTGQRYAAEGPSETAAKLLRIVIRFELRPDDVR